MKKSRIVLSLILVLLLVFVGSFVLTACGEKDGDNTQSDEQIDTPVTDASDSLPSNPNEDDNQKEDLPGGEITPPQEPEEDVHTCLDNDNNHICDTCDKTLSICVDANNNHLCDICNLKLTNCLDSNNNHLCDICDEEISECGDVDNNHFCDICNTKLDNCVDSNNNHLCDKCNIALTECINENDDHLCDICGTSLSSCIDIIKDHLCDICSEEISECGDVDNNHFCDICNTKLDNCVDSNNNHLCDKCNTALTECINENNDHLCDICRTALSECADKNNDNTCDRCGKIISDSTEYLVFNLKADNTYEVVSLTQNIKELFIPSTYQGVAVTSIKEWAFKKCTSLSKVTIPNTVTKIEYRAFEGCTSLTTIVIPNSVVSIEGDIFYGCYQLVEVYDLTYHPFEAGDSFFGFEEDYPKAIYNSLDIPSKVSRSNGYTIFDDGEEKIVLGYVGTETEPILPSGTTEINKYLFYNNDKITSIVIPDSVTCIGVSAFESCSSLTSLKYLGTIESWCNINFGGYYSNPLYLTKNLYISEELVTDLVIPNTITEIKDYAFNGCDSLTSVVIPNTVTSIGEGAFCNCDSLTSVTMTDSVTSIGYRAFIHCESLTSVNYIGTIESWCGITFVDGLANPLGHGAKLYLDGELVTTISIPNTITEIKANTFTHCTSLEKVIISNSVTSIGDDAFSYCSSLTSVTLGESVASIGENSFLYCFKLVEIYNLSNLTITAGDDYANGRIGTCVLDIYNSLDTPSKLSIDSNRYIIYLVGEEKILVGYNGNATDLNLPSGITAIKKDAFVINYAMTSVIIPDSVTSIGESAFYDCISLTTVYYGGTVEDWNSITIDDLNSDLTDATRYYYSETEPAEEGNYWHYVDGVPTPW